MSSGDAVIRVEALGKKYRLGRQRREPYAALRDVIAEKAKALFGRRPASRSSAPGSRPSEGEDFWALRDVSFEVSQGEVLGIIGRNGAGKSTLLKILSRITEPTTGRVEIGGRVASLLEVGTGFHPELTGRENIFLNGAILGMTRAEIRHKFDEIVAFAEVERFLDTPVKRYSSGMYVRLAFAVAAHLEPEILIIDEVLAVGDAAFQQKCLGKMQGVAQNEGRTVLFVSHNMVAVKQLCRTGLWLDAGRIRKAGSIDEVVHAYTSSVRTNAQSGDLTSAPTKGDGQVDLVSYRVTNSAGDMDPPPGTNEDLLICVDLKVKQAIAYPAFGVSIYNEFGVLMTCINTVEQGMALPSLPEGSVTACIRINRISFLPGLYRVDFWVMNPQCHIFVMAEDAMVFEVAQVPIYGTCHIDYRWGCVYSDIDFSFSQPRSPRQIE